MKISVCMKSGTGNHWDYDNCDLAIADIEMSFIPQLDSVISISRNMKEEKYLVREVYQHYNLPQSKEDKREFITVYVIPC